MSRTRITIQDAGLAIVQRLREAGHEALWAGGCVRDMLLNIEPTDIDVATNAHPEKIISLFRRTRQVGMQFGVVLVKQGPHWVEVATFRSDFQYTDGRRPERVIFTTAEHDAQRRDFTINGLFYDPIEKRVIDYVHGQEDLNDGLVRAIGEPSRRFEEDHLRMLRAVRFAMRFGFRIDPSTESAIREHASQLTRISAERIREELEKMLVCRTRANSFRCIKDVGLLPYLWPDSCWSSEGIERADRALAALPQEADFVLALAAMLHEHTPREAQRIARNLRCSNDEIVQIGWLIEHVDTVEHAEVLCLPEFKRLIAHPRFDDLLTLHHSVCQARHLSPEAGDLARQRREAIPKDRIAPPPFITGDDLIAMGLEPGPIFGELLDSLYDEQLDDRLVDRQDAMLRVQTLLASMQRPSQ